MTNDLIVWLRARLDEDEKAAQLSRSLLLIADLDRCAVPGSEAEATFRHFDRYGPARVLTEVEARRRIIDAAEEATGFDMQVDGEFRVGARDEVAESYVGDVILRLLALPHADRPGYRMEWRP